MDPAALALELVEHLDRAGFETAIGGALALGIWGVPRGTKDVDLNVFAAEGDYPRLLATLESSGCTATAAGESWSPERRAEFLRRAREGEVAVAYRDGIRIDIFVPSIDFYREAERTRRMVDLPGGRRVHALSPEALAVFKLLFFREKDLLDLKRLVARQGAALDSAWVRRQVADMVGEADDRVRAWDEIVRAHGPTSGS